MATTTTDVLTDAGFHLTPGTAGAAARKLEVVVLPVSDVDRSQQFYESPGWRLDADFSAGFKPQGR